jgi:Phage integrase central domain
MRVISAHKALTAAEAEKRLKEALVITLKDCAEKYIAAHEKSWRNEKHRAQWKATLTTDAYPVIGELPVASVDTALVTKILEPLWSGKPETASRFRGRIESVLNWAKVRGFGGGENPARWRGHLDNLLPAKGKVRAVKHHAALPAR